MDRNTIIGLLLIIAILVGYSIVSRPSQEEMERMRHQQDSIAQVQAQEQARLQEEIRKAEQTPAAAAQGDTAAGDTSRLQRLQASYGAFAEAAEGTNRFVTMENELMKVRFSTKGGRPYSVELKKYKRYDGTPLMLFDGDSTVFGFNFFSQNRSIATDQLYFEPSSQIDNINVTNDSATVKMRLKTSGEAYIEYSYTMKPNDYMMGFNVKMVNVNTLMSGNQPIVDFIWQVYSPRQEKGIKNESNYTALFYKSGDDVEEFSMSKETEMRKVNYLNWVSFKQQFFSWTLISNSRFMNADLRSSTPVSQQRYIRHYEAAIGMELNGQTEENMPMRMYFGPNQYKVLKKYDVGMEQLVPLGRNIIRWVNRFIIIPLFNWLGSFIGSYGLIILLMTIIVKVGLLPLTFKSLMSSAKMRVLKPQIDEISAKYPKEKAMERQQAVMALYRKAGVSPMGGCIPMLLQMPIWLALFRFFPASIELRQQSFLWATDLSAYDSILDLSFSIPFYGDHVSLFSLLMTAATLVQMRISNAQTDTSAMPGMKTMMYIMPVMFLFFFNDYASGLTYYYFVSNVISIVQNEVIRRSIDEKKVLARLNANSAKPKKKSRFQERLEKLQKQQQAQARANAKRKR